MDMNVLIVEDNRQMRQLICERIQHQCEQIYECADGRDALALYTKHRPDWVLMDWQMPEMNGITATREILAEYPNAQICMITTFDDELIRAEALAAGASEFVLKNNLFELETILEKSRGV